MKVAKANPADLNALMELFGAFESMTGRWMRVVPTGCEQPETPDDDCERLDLDNGEQAKRILQHLLEIAEKGSLFRAAANLFALLDPANNVVDPDSDVLEVHPIAKEGFAAKVARPLSEYHEDMGPVLWWKFPVDEPPYFGTPADDGFQVGLTCWTPLIVPDAHAKKGTAA